jgi:hypothetical protein
LDDSAVPELRAFLIFVDCFFLADVALNFTTAYYDPQLELRTERKEMAIHYVKTWLLVDLIGSVPFSLISLALSTDAAGKALSLFRVLKLPRMLRVLRLLQLLSVTWGPLVNEVIRMLKLLLLMALEVHCIACLWWYLAARESDAQNTWAQSNGLQLFDPTVSSVKRYVTCIYWAITTMATVGYGDIVAVNEGEMLFASAVMLLGAVMYGAIVGNVMLVLGNLNAQSSRHMMLLMSVTSYMHYRRFPAALRDRVLEYTEAQWKRLKGHDEEGILASLPVSLQTEIAVFLHGEMASKVPFFKGCTPSFIRCVVRALQHSVYLPRALIIYQDEPGDEMFFVSTGTVELLDGGVVFSVASPGLSFGESALTDGIYLHSARAVSYCNLCALHRDDFQKILEKYPRFAALVMAQCRQNIKLAMAKKIAKKFFDQE